MAYLAILSRFKHLHRQSIIVDNTVDDDKIDEILRILFIQFFRSWQ